MTGRALRLAEDKYLLLDELVALKARRCDGCAWWSSESGATWGFCEAFNDCATKPDHACNAWTPKAGQ